MKNDLTILYAEDDLEILENMTFLLSRYASTVYTAKNGKEALELYSLHQPNIVITDIMMPLMTGIVLAQTIREKNSTTPIVFITAYNEKEHLDAANKIPVSSYIMKPFNLDTLNKTIEKAIDEYLALEPR